MNKNNAFSVNIEHPMYKRYVQQFERYGFGESVDLDIRTIFHLLPDSVKGFTLTERGKENLLVDQFLYLDEFTYLYYEPKVGQLMLQYSPLLEPEKEKQRVLVQEEDCAFMVPCPHPLHLNTFEPAFSDWIDIHEAATGSRKVVHIPDPAVLTVLPDVVQGTILTDTMKRDLLMKEEYTLNNGNILLMDYGAQALFILKRSVESASATYADKRQLNRFECQFYYEHPRNQSMLLSQGQGNTSTQNDQQMGIHL